MKRSMNICKLIILVVVLGFVFLLPLCACQRKTSTTKETITTTETITTKEYKNPFNDFYYQGVKVIEYEFVKENDKIIWKFWLEAPGYADVGTFVESDVIQINNSEPEGAYRTLDGIDYLRITEESYQYILSII